VTVYELRKADKAIGLAYRDRSEYGRQRELTGRKVEVDTWSPPAVEVIRDGSSGTEPSDVVLLGVEAAFSGRAVKALGDFLGVSGQLLPLLSADGEFYLWNVTVLIDALDEDASDLERFSSGRVMMVNRWVFRPERLHGVTAFKIPQLPQAFTFVTDTFVDRFAAAGLSGLAPLRLWSMD
jgi:hypothetical protein